MSNFTPGPWDHDSGMYGNGKQYHSIFAPADDVVIAEFNAMPEFNPEQGKANAALIAAAPDMYEALKALLECVDTFAARVGWPDNNPREAARAALDKADGKPTIERANRPNAQDQSAR